MYAAPPDLGPPPKPKELWQFRLSELLLFMAVASGFMFLTAPFVRNYNPVAAAIVECIGLTFFAAVWWKLRTRKWVEAATLAAVMFALAALLLPPVQFVYGSTRREECGYNLKAIGIALHNYHEKFGSLPPAYVADANGKRMHSWRVILLPFLDRNDLFRQYDFSEPWDGPNNIQLASEITAAYQCPEETHRGGSTASYLAVVGQGTMWPGTKAISFSDVKDGKGNTIMVVEVAASGIQGSEPRDLDYDQLSLQINATSGGGISSLHGKTPRSVAYGAETVYGDGSVHLLHKDLKPDILKLLLEINDGQPIGDY